MKNAIRKLKSNSGESIAEVLIAATVIALGFLMLASMMGSSAKMIRNSEEYYEEYIDSKNKVEEPSVSGKKESLKLQDDVTFEWNIPVTMYKQGNDDAEVVRYEYDKK